MIHQTHQHLVKSVRGRLRFIFQLITIQDAESGQAGGYSNILIIITIYRICTAGTLCISKCDGRGIRPHYCVQDLENEGVEMPFVAVEQQKYLCLSKFAPLNNLDNRQTVNVSISKKHLTCILAPTESKHDDLSSP